MKPSLSLIICAVAALLAIGAAFYLHGRGLQQTAAAEAHAAREARRADSLATQLQVAAAWTAADLKQTAGVDAGKQAQADENTIRATPAAGWDDDSLARFLASPNDLHAPRSGRQERR